MKELKKRMEDAIEKSCHYSDAGLSLYPNHAAESCAKIALEEIEKEAVAFASWCIQNTSYDERFLVHYYEGIVHSLKQLFTIYKEQKNEQD